MTKQWKHIKRGTVYTEIGRGTMQSVIDAIDGRPVVIYQGQDGEIWVRAVTEFEDGRFVPVPDPEDADYFDKVLEPLWSPWYKWTGVGECPIVWARAGEWAGRAEYANISIACSVMDAAHVKWHHIGFSGDIAAFRYRIDYAPADFTYEGTLA